MSAFLIAASRLTADNVTAALALAGILGAAHAVFSSRQVKDSLATITAANDELRAEVADHDRRRAQDREACERELAELRGQMKAMTGEFGRQIASSIADEWRARQARDDDHIARRRAAHRQGGDPT